MTASDERTCPVGPIGLQRLLNTGLIRERDRTETTWAQRGFTAVPVRSGLDRTVGGTLTPQRTPAFLVISFRRRLLLSLLLGVEALYLAFAVVVLLVPWDVTFSAFDGRPIGTLEAYVRATPYLAVTLTCAASVVGMWARGGRAGRTCVTVMSALHAAGAVWFLVENRTVPSTDVLIGAVILLGYAAVLLALGWSTAAARHAMRSSIS